MLRIANVLEVFEPKSTLSHHCRGLGLLLEQSGNLCLSCLLEFLGELAPEAFVFLAYLSEFEADKYGHT